MTHAGIAVDTVTVSPLHSIHDCCDCDQRAAVSQTVAVSSAPSSPIASAFPQRSAPLRPASDYCSAARSVEPSGRETLVGRRLAAAAQQSVIDYYDAAAAAEHSCAPPTTVLQSTPPQFFTDAAHRTVVGHVTVVGYAVFG